MDLDLTAVESFIAVTESRHFGRAADKLGISASALTKRIKRLEAAVGVPLIERDTAGYAGLTPAGRRFVQFAPQLLHRPGRQGCGDRRTRRDAAARRTVRRRCRGASDA